MIYISRGYLKFKSSLLWIKLFG